MAGSITVGGMAAGLLVGEIRIGPATMVGKSAISEIFNLELTSNVDKVVVVPNEAVAFCVVFTFSGTEPTELKVRTNLDNADTGFPIPASGFFAAPLLSTVTELKFKAATPPAVFQLVFV